MLKQLLEKLSILLIMSIFCLNAHSQRKIRRTAPKQNIEFQHVNFMGVPINNTYTVFTKKLLTKGLTTLPTSTGDGEVMTGTVAGIPNCYVSISTNQNGNVFEVAVSKKDITLEEAERVNTAFSNVLLKGFSDSEKDVAYFNFFDERGCTWNLDEYSLLKGGKTVGRAFGTIYSSGENYSTTFYLVDKSNFSGSFSNYLGKNFNLNSILSSSTIRPVVYSCNMTITDDLLDFQVQLQNGTHYFHVGEPDRSRILRLLTDANISNQVKCDILSTYLYVPVGMINNGFEKFASMNAHIGPRNCFFAVCDAYRNLLAREKQKQDMRNFSVSDCLAYFLKNIVYTKKEQKTFENLFGKEGFNSLILSFTRMYFNGGSTTQWDMLNNAQKAVIHEHDNAK